MDISSAFSGLFPDRTPTWTDILVAACAISQLAIHPTDFRNISWAVATGGFIIFAVALGPGANSTIGKRIGSWWKAIGYGGRAAGIILYAVGAWITSQLIHIPMTLVISFVDGGMLAIAVFVVLHVLSAREVSGWT